MAKIMCGILLLFFIFALCGCNVTSSNKLAGSEISMPPPPISNQTVETNETSTSSYKEKETVQEISEEMTEEETDPYGNKITGSDDSSNFPLYAMIKSEDIYLYGVKPYGMVLYQNGKGTYFDWPGLMPRRVLPQMMYYDFDNDGNKELAVTLYVGSGTSFAVMDLHILKIEEKDDYCKPIYTDYSLVCDDVHDWMVEKILTTLSEDKNTFRVDFNGKSYTIDCFDDPKISGAFTGVDFDDLVHFKFEDSRIKVTIGLGALYENLATPQYFGDIEAYVVFDGESFKLEDYTFTLDP